MRLHRIISLLLLTASIAARAAGPRRVGVAELEQILSASQGQTDGKVARELSDMVLTERASSVRLTRWETEFPGKHCHDALMTLAGASAFLELPSADIPSTAPPAIDAQTAMIRKTIDYVGTTISRLPNFYATRTTEHFEDTPVHVHSDWSNGVPDRDSGFSLKNTGVPYGLFRDTGKSSIMVRYVDGHEVSGTKKAGVDPGQPALTLTTQGEFGPILVSVMLGAVKGKIYWKHWEQGASGTYAVFRYSVPVGQSGYEVELPLGRQILRLFPAFHGEIAVDPATGAILRVTAVADLAPPNQLAMSSIAVEYATVAIGGKSYICPVHSIALARFAIGDPLVLATAYKTQLNDVAFVDYHIFRAESRILTDAPIGDPDTPAPPK